MFALRNWLTSRAVVVILAMAQPAIADNNPKQNPAPNQRVEASDIPSHFEPPTADYDYVKRTAMIPMRDGVKLYTVIVIPKSARNAPMILTRTPYNAKKRAQRMESPFMLSTLPQGDEIFVGDGYIRVFQDIRGKYGSEGDYVMTRPPMGPFNHSNTDDTTDAYDTIDWLVKNVNESNGRVGMLGSSYEGWTVVMALLGPHPALKVAAPESPLVDGWMGDDWFHFGAFRNVNLDYIPQQTTARGEGDPVLRSAYDDYATFLRAGSTGAYAAARGLDQFPWYRRMANHPTYDQFWQNLALDKQLRRHPSRVPTMWEQGLWDQEDMWGANHSYAELKAAGYGATNYLVMGPWRHSGANYEGSSLGALTFNGDTATQWRREVLKPFFDQYLKPDSPPVNTPHAIVYNSGENHWERFATWPLACEHGCPAPLTPLYLQSNFALGFAAPDGGADRYVSDPAKPVTYLQRPINFADTKRWGTWLVNDQRNTADGRPDVLTYESTPLTEPLRISGAPIADIYAVTTGTDLDFVVKLIDVYPDQMASTPELGGYQLSLSMDIFRGRYRDSFEHPAAIPAGQIQRYRFVLPNTNHIFKRGHRIMVQVQSSLFPLYDRNPQTYVENVFEAKPADYRAATVEVQHAPGKPSAVWLPLVPVTNPVGLLP